MTSLPPLRSIMGLALALTNCVGSGPTVDSEGAMPGRGGGSGLASDAGSDLGFTPERYLERQVSASCRRVFECCSSEEIAAERIGGDADTCITAQTSNVYQFFLPLYESSLAAGRVSYDAERALECVEYLETVQCGDPYAFDAHCDGVFTALVASGGACQQHFECATGYCETQRSSRGACQSRKALGSECFEHAECASGTCDVYDVCGEEPPVSSCWE